MDAANIWIQIGIFVVTAGAGAVAWWQAIAASRAKKDAEAAEKRAVKAAEKSAVAAAASAEQHARSADAAERALPPTWSLMERVSSTVCRLRNDSSRHIIITAFEPQPIELGPALSKVLAPLPTRVEYGDAFEFLILARGAGPRITSVRIRWRFEAETEDQWNERRVLQS
ncbi:hypothetical protein [Rathayibacter sp. VKM Ac-2801]|uniref:hypothetical protein n=1 Tax=Rathayibacter sp. VKM Ac-2801 TaxID=2609255 RepID=UPI00131FBEBB|nr:hypothetical protein [Rathayibacter sp. VKM Ac-2801]QHC71030.1 hypothetical protein GSU45_12050 [Rathayibacter sp. VKM Ac-2801]